MNDVSGRREHFFLSTNRGFATNMALLVTVDGSDVCSLAGRSDTVRAVQQRGKRYGPNATIAIKIPDYP